MAAAFGYADIAAYLLDFGASPTLRDSQGLSPLHWAAHYGRHEVAALLLQPLSVGMTNVVFLGVYELSSM